MRDVNRDKLLRELGDFETEECEHTIAKRVRDRLKVSRGAKGVPIPEDFAEHFGCLKCFGDFLLKKIDEARRQGIRDAIIIIETNMPTGEG